MRGFKQTTFYVANVVVDVYVHHFIKQNYLKEPSRSSF